MLSIAVCDDEKAVINEVEKILSDYCDIKKIEYKISSYFDGANLLMSNKKFDVIFLDIEMNYSNGIEVAEQIRQQDMNVPIVYITNYVDYWRRAFKVHAFGFITKPFKKDDLYNIMNDYFSSIHDAADELITLVTDKGVVCLQLNEIYYFIFESKKKVYVCTSKERILIKENITDIYAKLDKTRFYQTRRDCIVNLKHIQKIQNEFVIVMKNGDMLPLAQKKKNEFMTILSAEFTNILKGRNV